MCQLCQGCGVSGLFSSIFFSTSSNKKKQLYMNRNNITLRLWNSKIAKISRKVMETNWRVHKKPGSVYSQCRFTVEY